MKRTSFAFLLIATLGLVSCTSNTLPNYSVLGELRVVALELDQPEVAAGATVTLTPFLSDLNGAGRPLTYEVEACADFGITFGAKPSCAGQADRVVLVSSAPVTGLTSPNYTAVAPTVPIPVPADILQSHNAVDQFNGIAYLIFYTVFPPSGTPVTALRRVIVSTKTPKNQNPVFASPGPITANGATLAAFPAGPVKLLPNLADGAQETYPLRYPDGTQVSQQETLVVSWFVSDGILDLQKTGTLQSDTWTPPPVAPTTHGVVVIAVVRDGRGGEAHAMAQF